MQPVHEDDLASYRRGTSASSTATEAALETAREDESEKNNNMSARLVIM